MIRVAPRPREPRNQSGGGAKSQACSVAMFVEFVGRGRAFRKEREARRTITTLQSVGPHRATARFDHDLQNASLCRSWSSVPKGTRGPTDYLSHFARVPSATAAGRYAHTRLSLKLNRTSTLCSGSKSIAPSHGLPGPF